MFSSSPTFLIKETESKSTRYAERICPERERGGAGGEKNSNIGLRGLFNKIVRTNDVQVAKLSEEVFEKTKSMFPQSQLPQPLVFKRLEKVDLDLPTLMQAFLTLKRGKAPGLSGWTRELFTPLLGYEITHPFFAFLLSVFTSVVNADVDHSKEMILRTGALTLLTYKDNAFFLLVSLVRQRNRRINWLHTVCGIGCVINIDFARITAHQGGEVRETCSFSQSLTASNRVMAP